MNYKNPVNVLNGLKYKHYDLLESIQNSNKPSHLVPIKAYKNSYNIVKPFTKPISKIF